MQTNASAWHQVHPSQMPRKERTIKTPRDMYHMEGSIYANKSGQIVTIQMEIVGGDPIDAAVMRPRPLHRAMRHRSIFWVRLKGKCMVLH